MHGEISHFCESWLNSHDAEISGFWFVVYYAAKTSELLQAAVFFYTC